MSFTVLLLLNHDFFSFSTGDFGGGAFAGSEATEVGGGGSVGTGGTADGGMSTEGFRDGKLLEWLGVRLNKLVFEEAGLTDGVEGTTGESAETPVDAGANAVGEVSMTSSPPARELNVARPFAPSMVHLQLSSEQLVPVRTDTPVPI